MSSPSSWTLPSACASGTTSCIRLRHRMTVLFPHPEGPMMAVTRRGWMVRFTPSTALRCAYHALRSRTSSRGPASRGGSTGSRDWAGRNCPNKGVATRPFGLPVSVSVRPRWSGVEVGVSGATNPPSYGPACKQAEQGDQCDKHKGAAPGLGVPVLVGSDGIVVDLNRQGGDGLQQIDAEE